MHISYSCLCCQSVSTTWVYSVGSVFLALLESLRIAKGQGPALAEPKPEAIPSLFWKSLGARGAERRRTFAKKEGKHCIKLSLLAKLVSHSVPIKQPGEARGQGGAIAGVKLLPSGNSASSLLSHTHVEI